MPENQRHGLDWENDIKTKVFRLEVSPGYTARHDVDKERNPFNPNENISIKTTGRSTVDLGDALRVFHYTPTEVHTGIVVVYQQQDDRKVLRGVYEIDLDNRELLWGTVTAEEIQELSTLVKSMPAGQRNNELDTLIKAKKKALNAKSGLVKFNPKIDSKNQRRLQCSIPKFAETAGLIKSHTAEPVVRGVAIESSFTSGRRVRNRRVQEPGGLVLG